MAKRRRDESPERQALREMVSGYLKDNPVKNGTGECSHARNDVSYPGRKSGRAVWKGSLDGEMDEELGYSKYDFRNKETDNNRKGYNLKTLNTSYRDMDLDVPRDRNGSLSLK